MRKRIFSIFLALCLCAALLPTTAFADDLQGSGTEDNPWLLTGTDVFVQKNEGETSTMPYKILDTDNKPTYYLPAGSYKLDADITLNDGYLNVIGDVTLDLNGKTLTANIRVGTADASDTLLLQGSSGNLTNVSGKSGAALMIISGSATLTDGITIKATSVAVNIYNNATFYADGGTVSGDVKLFGKSSIQRHDSAKNTTTFEGDVVNGESGSPGGTISAGIFKGNVTNYGTISGGTFEGTVTNKYQDDSNKGSIDNTSSILNNGIFAYAGGYKVNHNGSDVDITKSDETSVAAAQAYIKSLNLGGTGYVQMGEDTDPINYTHSGEKIDNLSTKKVVTFDLNDDKGTIFQQGAYDGNTAEPTDPTRDGYTFGGWYKDSPCTDGNKYNFDNQNINDNITLYAKWTIKTYTISYQAGQYGSGSAASDTKTHDISLTLRGAIFSRDGYTQTGWATSNGGAKAYDLGGSYTADKAATLYPVWTKNSTGSSGGSSSPSHAVSAPSVANGTVKISPKNAKKGETVTLTATPDEGYALETLSVLDKNGNEIALNEKANGKYTFKMPNGDVTVAATFAEAVEDTENTEDIENTETNDDDKNTENTTIPTLFTDVPENAYYYDAVLWAVKNGITGGVDETHFAPNLPCTRAQLVTFLWRAAGCPVAEYDAGFADVNENDYYSQAVRWAASLGIVSGYGDGLFGSDDEITREQVAAILYRFTKAMGKDVSVGEDTNILSYLDAFEISEYAIGTFQWAVGAEIIHGADGSLMPQEFCTRAQIVTMLYRLLGE